MASAMPSTPPSYEAPGQGVLAMLIAIATIVIAARVTSRYIQGKCNLIEDHLAYFSYVVLLGHIISCMLSVSKGSMSTIELVNASPENHVFMTRAFNALGFFYNLCMITVKLSVLLLLRRIFTMNQRWFRIGWWGNFVIIFPIWTVINFVFLGILIARNGVVSANLAKYAIQTGSMLTVISDLLILALPLASISRLQLARRQKVGAGGIFALGLLTTGVSAARAGITIYNENRVRDPGYANFVDIILGASELTSALTCASLPVLNPFLNRTSELLQRGGSAMRSLVSLRSGSISKSFVSSRDTSSARHPAGSRTDIVRTDSIEIDFMPTKTSGTSAREA